MESCKSAATGGATGFGLLAVSLGVLRAEFCNSAATGRAGDLRMPSSQPGAAVPQVSFPFMPSSQPGAAVPHVCGIGIGLAHGSGRWRCQTGSKSAR